MQANFNKDGKSGAGTSQSTSLLHVLLVDDSKEDNFIHRRQLKRAFPDCEVVVVTDGQQAIDLLLERADADLPAFELICLDVNMPVLDAWGFLEQYPHLPLEAHADLIALMISTALPAEARQIAEHSPFVSFFVSKPFTGAVLSDEVLRCRQDSPRKLKDLN